MSMRKKNLFSCTWYKSLLTGLDTTDFKTKVDPEHLVKPESLHSTFDKPASVSIALSKWYYESHIYIVVTSYKYLRNGERCQEGKEFDCFSYNFLSASTDRMCISTNLACDGVPNCGQSFLPNQVSCHFFSLLLMVFCFQNCSDLLWEKLFSDREKLLKFEAEGREFSKFLKGQNNFW